MAAKHSNPGGQPGHGNHHTAPAVHGTKGPMVEATKSSSDLHHSIYYWVSVRPGQEIAHLDPVSVALRCGVPVKELFSYWEKEVNCDIAVRTLPRTLMLIVCFAAMLLNHETVADRQSVEKAIRFDIEENANFAFNGIGTMGHKNYQDVNSFTDFYSWLRLGFASIYLPQNSSVSEGSTLSSEKLNNVEKSVSAYLGFNRKVGPVKLVQEVAQEGPCRSASSSGRTCYAPGTDFVIHPTEFDVAVSPFAEDTSGNGTVWFSVLEDLNEQVDMLETSRWLRASTRRWKLSFVTYNADFDILTVTDIHFVLSRSGRIWKELSFMSLVLSPYGNLWGLVWEILFFGSITTIFLEELKEIFVGVCAKGTDGKRRCRCGYFLMDYFTVWNFVDWCSIIIAYALLGMWIQRCLMIADLESTLTSSRASCRDPSARHLCQELTQTVMAKASSAGIMSFSTSLVSSFFPFCILLRLFKTFSLQPRLAVVTRTLWMSFADLVHFGIIFLSVFVTYVFMAMGFFGRTVEGYADFGMAFITLFRSLMGDADFVSMEDQAGRAIAGVFHISFMLGMLLILLNMLIAIIMDVYGETKRSAQFSDPVWDDIMDFFQRWYHARKGDRISLSHAKDTFMAYLEEKAEEEEEADRLSEEGKTMKTKKSMFVELEESLDIVTTEDLMKKVKMSEDQAWDSILQAVKWFEKNADMDVPTVEVLRGVRQLQQKFGCSPQLPQSSTDLLSIEELEDSTGPSQSEQAAEADPMVRAAVGPDLRTLLADGLNRVELEGGLSMRAKKMVSQLLDTAQTILEEEGVEKRL